MLVHSENLTNTNFIFFPIILSLVLCIWNIKLSPFFYFMTFQISKPKHHTFSFTIFFCGLNITIFFINFLYGVFFQSFPILFFCIIAFYFINIFIDYDACNWGWFSRDELYKIIFEMFISVCLFFIPTPSYLPRLFAIFLIILEHNQKYFCH